MPDYQPVRTKASDTIKGTVLVVGGAGYVGSHAAKALSQSGYVPVVYDNMTSSSYPVAQFGPVERGDMRDQERLERVFAQYKPVAVVHCATSKFFAKTQFEPIQFYENIAIGTLTLLETMQRSSVTDLCVITSASIYGKQSALNIPEQTPTEPLTPYAACLSAIENMIGDFSLAHDLRWISLRLFGVGGADLESELGEDHPNETSLIPIAIDAALGHREYVPILGSHYATRDGTALRDFVHVSDVADAIVLALDHLARQDGLGPYNIGTGTDVSVLEIIRSIEAISGRKCPIRYEGKLSTEPYALSADPDRAHRELGWQPKHSQLDVILRTAFEFRQSLWARRIRPSRGDEGLDEDAKLQHHEAITDIPASRLEHQDLLAKLDAFLKR